MRARSARWRRRSRRSRLLPWARSLGALPSYPRSRLLPWARSLGALPGYPRSRLLPWARSLGALPSYPRSRLLPWARSLGALASYPRSRLLPWVLVLGVLAGCGDESAQVLVDFPPPRLAALTSHEAPIELRLEPESKVEVELRGKRHRETLGYGAVQGHVELQPNDLHQMRGEIRVLLREPQFERDPPALTPALLARALRLVADASSRRETRLASPYATFRIREVIESSARALRLAPRRTKEGHTRTVAQLRVRGELELAGTRSEQTVGLTIAARANEHDPDVYERFEVDCSSSLNLSLKRYGIELWSAEAPTADEPRARFTSARIGCQLVATPR